MILRGYRKKSVEVLQYLGDVSELKEFCGQHVQGSTPDSMFFKCNAGLLIIQNGQFIVKNENGSFELFPVERFNELFTIQITQDAEFTLITKNEIITS